MEIPLSSFHAPVNSEETHRSVPFRLPTLYARREPTNDTVAIQYLDAKTLASCHDVIIYHDPDCNRFYANFPWSIILNRTAVIDTSLSTDSATDSFGSSNLLDNQATHKHAASNRLMQPVVYLPQGRYVTLGNYVQAWRLAWSPRDTAVFNKASLHA